MRPALFALAVLAACDAAPPAADNASEPLSTGVTRDRIIGDVYHYGFTVRVGDGPNARLRIHRVVRERAPFWPRPTSAAVMMMHGDFATFATNFAPVLQTPASAEMGMAVWLAERGIDVWGFDRRWTQAPRDGADLSDFDAMGIDQELEDVGTALAFARGVRLVTDASLERMTLVGFSRGGQLGYYYASDEATQPSWRRHLKGLVPLDVYASISPEEEDLRQFWCGVARDEYAALAAGFTDVPNDFQIDVGELALSAPDDQTPFQFFFPGLTNRQVLLTFVGQTYQFFPASPLYHLNAPVLDGGAVTGLRESPEDVVALWLAAAAPHQSMRESADTDALLCGDPPLPADVPLSRIRVPLLLIAAAGGYGELARFSASQVGSTDVTALVIRRLPMDQEAEDFGHSDILFARDAASLAWQPLLAWLRSYR